MIIVAECFLIAGTTIAALLAMVTPGFGVEYQENNASETKPSIDQRTAGCN